MPEKKDDNVDQNNFAADAAEGRNHRFYSSNPARVYPASFGRATLYPERDTVRNYGVSIAPVPEYYRTHFVRLHGQCSQFCGSVVF